MHNLFRFAACPLVAAALLLTGCGDADVPAPPSVGQTGAAVKTLTKGDAGKTFTFHPGTAFRIELPSNPSTGFSWQVAPHNNNVAVMPSTFVRNDGPQLIVGGGGNEIFPCQAKKTGETTIRLTYRRPWKGGEVGEKVEFKIVVR